MYKVIAEESFPRFCQEFAAALNDGWRVRKGCYGDSGYFGSTLYTIEVERTEGSVEAFKAHAEKATLQPRLTRQEIAAKARAAKMAKAAERASAGNTATLDIDTVR